MRAVEVSGLRKDFVTKRGQRRGRGELRDRFRRDLQPARAQRRGEDDVHQDARDAAHPHLGNGPGIRAGRRARRDGGAPTHHRGIRDEGKTVLLTTHYMYEAHELSDRVAIINRGRIVCLDTPQALKRSLGATRIIRVETDVWTPACEAAFYGAFPGNHVEAEVRGETVALTIRVSEGGVPVGELARVITASALTRRSDPRIARRGVPEERARVRALPHERLLRARHADHLVPPIYFLIVSFAPDGTSAGLEAWIGTSDYFAYLPIGLVVSYVIMTIFWNLGFALMRLMDIGMLETIWSCPVPRMIYGIAESLFSMARLAVEVAIVLVVYRFLYGFELPAGMASTLRYLPPFVLLMYGFGIGFASLVLLVKDVNTMADTSSFLIQGLTGTQNPPRVFPRFLVAIALAIPITHFIDLLRVETLGITPLVGTDVQLVVFLASSVVFPIVGVVAFRRVERRSRIRGDLHVH